MSQHTPAPATHGIPNRHPEPAALKSGTPTTDPGLFGRMFPGLPPLVASDDHLFELAEAMRDMKTEPDPAANNPNIPAGFTYLGQFVDHDITLDTTPLAEKVSDPTGVTNFRSPRLDLDALYGLGPSVNPELFARGPAMPSGARPPGPSFLIGKTIQGGGDPTVPFPLPNDLPRNPEGQAIIGDPRNDENLLVAQTHLAFLKFHNAIVKHLEAKGTPKDRLFPEARRMTMWHYQWIVLFDFVERLTEPGLIRRIKHEGRKFYRFKSKPYMPVEFAVAAYRLGHSMVRENYSHNRVFGPPPSAIPAGDLGTLFGFTGKSGQIIGDLAPNPPTGPLPVERLPSDWAIDWRRFFEVLPANPPGVLLNPSRRLDPFVVPALHTLPDQTPGNRNAVLPFRNLKRGVIMGLPSGQAVARRMELPVLTEAELTSGPDGAVVARHFRTATPLWYYILKEAEVKHQGLRLGPVGSRIIAEVFLGIVHGDHESFMWQQANWKPELPSKVPGTFTMADMLRFVGDISPVDGIATV
jgi:hypothetical protein